MFSVANEPKYVAFNCVYSHSITRVKFHPSFLEVQLGVCLIHIARHLIVSFFLFFFFYYCISRCSLILFEDKDVF